MGTLMDYMREEQERRIEESRAALEAEAKLRASLTPEEREALEAAAAETWKAYADLEDSYVPDDDEEDEDE